MRIGFIGLGNVGLALALNLLRGGHELVVTDLRTGRGDRLVGLGACFVDSHLDVVDGSDIVVTSLPSPDAVDSVVSGDGGILSHMSAGCLWLEMSTTDVDQVKRNGLFAAGRGIDVLEAPITGGCNRAWSGEISILVGGDEGVFERYRPVLSLMGGEIAYIGALGNASALKLITNMLAFIHLWSSGEAMVLANRCGIDLSRAYDGIRISSGNSFAHETECQLVLNGSYDVGFTMGLALKDMRLVMDLCRKTSTPLEMASLVSGFFEDALERYGEGSQSTEAVRLLEDRFGVLRADGFPSVLAGMEAAKED